MSPSMNPGMSPEACRELAVVSRRGRRDFAVTPAVLAWIAGSLVLTACYPDCPGKEQVEITYSIHSDLTEEYGQIIFDSDVDVTEVVSRGDQWDIDVSGLDQEGIERDVRISLTTIPSIDVPFEAGEELRMQYVQDEPAWTNTHVVFWREGELLLGFVDQAIIVGSSMWMDPFELKVRRGYCPKKSDDCGARERAGIEFLHPDGPSELVMDHGSGTLLGTPAYRLIVERAFLNYDSLFVPCPGRYRGWLRALIHQINP